MKPRILEVEEYLNRIGAPCLKVYVDGKFEHGYRGEGSVQKAVDEIVYWVDDDTVVEFSIDDIKYELPVLQRHHFWGVFEDEDQLKERVEYLVDFHKAFYYA